MDDQGKREGGLLPEVLLGRHDLARLFAVTPETITDWVRRGQLPQAVVIGKNVFWSPAAIAALLDGRA